MSYAGLCTTGDRFLDRTRTTVCDESIDMAGLDKAILNDVGVELLRCPAPAAGSPMKADALVNLPILAVSIIEWAHRESLSTCPTHKW